LAAGFASIAAVIAVDRRGMGLRTGPRDLPIATGSDPVHLRLNLGVHRALDAADALAGNHAVFVCSLACAPLSLVVLAGAVSDLRIAGGKATLTDQRPRRRMGARVSDVSQPAPRRVLMAAGLLGFVTVGDAFLYLAVYEAGSAARTYFPILFVGTRTGCMTVAIPLGRLADRVARSRVFPTGYLPPLGVYVLSASGIAQSVVAPTRFTCSGPADRRGTPAVFSPEASLPAAVVK
jgi:hypothetical protein